MLNYTNKILHWEYIGFYLKKWYNVSMSKRAENHNYINRLEEK